jgi:hypothetical protein
MGGRGVAGGPRAYWFPLVLLGFGLLALLGWTSVLQDYGWFAYAPQPAAADYLEYVDQETAVATAFISVEVPYSLGRFPVQDWTWALLVILTLVATAAWYGRRTRRAGGSVHAHVAIAVGGTVAVPVGYVAAGLGAVADESGALITSVALPLVVLGALAWRGRTSGSRGAGGRRSR